MNLKFLSFKQHTLLTILFVVCIIEPRSRKETPFQFNMAAKTKTWSKVFLFGDSITQRSFSPEGCWGSLLADFLFRRCDVLNRGFSGYNTRMATHILPQLMTEAVAKETVAMTIFLGANDASHAEIGKAQHVPREEYTQHVRDMVEHCLSVGLRRDQIILITPPAVWGEDWDDHCRREGKDGIGSRSNDLVSSYAASVCKLSEEMGTSLVDLYSNMISDPEYKSYLCDGLHLSSSGSQLLFNLLQPIVSKLTSDLPDMLYPDWKDIGNEDTKDAKSSLHRLGYL